MHNTRLDKTLPTRNFCVADLNAKGEVLATAEYAYEQLEQLPGAADLITVFATHIWRTPEEFEISIPLSGSRLNFRWRSSAPTAGITSLRSVGELATVGLMATGINSDADQITLTAFQQHLLRELHGTEFEAGFDLMELKRRPLVATISFRDPTEDVDKVLAALADRCFAAAYFRYHHLA